MTPLAGAQVFEPVVFRDDRGYFTETYNARVFAEAGLHDRFVQDNQAESSYGVIRGLHYQTGLHMQSKLVRVFSGEVLDVIVDLRPDSPTYGQVYQEILSGENMKQLYVPRGFAHGYAVLSDRAVFVYKCDNLYAPDAEGGIHPEDTNLNIDWRIPAADRKISEKDRGLPAFGTHRPILS